MSALEAAREKFEAAGAEITAINPGSLARHKKYAKKRGFDFPLIADKGKEIARKYGTLGFLGLYIKRKVYVVNADNKVIFAERGMPPPARMLKAIAGDIN